VYIGLATDCRLAGSPLRCVLSSWCSFHRQNNKHS